MITRHLESSVRSAACQYPVVTLTGPRQSGKTTLVRSTFPHHTYCNLEQPDTRALAESDPKAFFSMYPTPLIIDEVQRVPELLSWIQVDVDEHPEKGRYILTGSHQFRLHHAITQSLAGRTSLLRLLPLSMAELQQHDFNALTQAQTSTDTSLLDKNSMLFRGCMPRIYNDNLPPSDLYRNYFQTYVERDVRELIQLKNLRPFETFMRLLAARVGQTLNLHSLANDIGVSSTTLKEWISILEASYIIYLLPPYYQNYGKRLTKSPKLYFIEPGLAAWLLGIESPQHAMRDPLHGSLFENLIVIEALKQRLNSGNDPCLYYWRDSAQREIDLLFDQQRCLTPIEIKSSQTWNKDFLKGIRWMQKNIPNTKKGAVIYAGDQHITSDDYQALPFSQMHALFEKNE